MTDSVFHLSVIPQVPNSSSAYLPHCRIRIMSISSCSLSMKICCMQPWKRFSLVSHFLTVLLVFGQPKRRKANFVRFDEHRFDLFDLFVVSSYLRNRLTSKKVAVACPNSERVGDL